MRYTRETVVFSDLGFKIGSKQGGNRYALVIENDNTITNKTVTVIPSKSLKKTDNPDDIDKKHEVFLGYEIFKDEIDKTKPRLQNATGLKQLKQ